MGQRANMGSACTSQKFCEAPDASDAPVTFLEHHLADASDAPQVSPAAAVCQWAQPPELPNLCQSQELCDSAVPSPTPPRLPLLLKILHPDGRTWVHEANPGSTLAQLKLALAEKCGVAPEGAHLIELWFSGYQLPAKNTLEECTELCDGSEIELQGVQTAVAVAPLQSVVSAPVLALDCGVVTGRAVQCRDGSEEWRDGVIGNINPLKVMPNGWDVAYKWDEVRLHSAASTISSRILDERIAVRRKSIEGLTWDCLGCTLINQHTNAVCAACGRDKPNLDREQQLKACFEIIDTNENGVLDFSELRAVFGAAHAAEFVRFCSSQNGRSQSLTPSEFIQGIVGDTVDLQDAEFQDQWLNRITKCISTTIVA